jgi:tetratricopeptide (TPR) repeat protein
LKLSSEAAAALLKRHARNAEAYNLVLKGRYLGAARELAEEKIGCYQRALQYDPEYVDAYIGLADVWVGLVAQGTVAPRQVMGKAQEAIHKAQQLDEGEPDGHFIAALIKAGYEWDWPGAEQEFLRALQLNPNSSSVRIRYARHLALMGRREDARNQIEQIRRIDPVSADLRGIEAAVLYFTRDYDGTIEHARAVLAGEPKTWLLYFWMGRAYESKGMLPQAIDALEKWYGIPTTLQGRGFGMLASIYARAGRREEALRLLNSTIARSRQAYVSPCSVAIIYIGLADFERAFEWLEKAYEERDQSLVSLKADPAYDPLRGNPRFVSLMRRMKLE